MFRRVLSVVLGFITGFVLVVLIQMISAKMYPPPSDMLPQDTEAIKQYFSTLPIEARLIIVLAHVVGTFGGCYIAAKLADKSKFYMAIVVGVLMLVSTISSNMASYIAVSIFLLDTLLTLAAVYLGARIGSRS